MPRVSPQPRRAATDALLEDERYTERGREAVARPATQDLHRLIIETGFGKPMAPKLFNALLERPSDKRAMAARDVGRTTSRRPPGITHGEWHPSMQRREVSET
jgi:hypothetical protein